MKKETLDELIIDEVEAVNSYNKAILSGIFSKDEINVLRHIRDEEVEHIKELKELKGGKN